MNPIATHSRSRPFSRSSALTPERGWCAASHSRPASLDYAIKIDTAEHDANLKFRGETVAWNTLPELPKLDAPMQNGLRHGVPRGSEVQI